MTVTRSVLRDYVANTLASISVMSICYTTSFDVLSAVRESREAVSIHVSDRAKIHARRNVQFRFQTSSCLVNTYEND